MNTVRRTDDPHFCAVNHKMAVCVFVLMNWGVTGLAVGRGDDHEVDTSGGRNICHPTRFGEMNTGPLADRMRQSI